MSSTRAALGLYARSGQARMCFAHGMPGATFGLEGQVAWAARAALLLLIVVGMSSVARGERPADKSAKGRTVQPAAPVVSKSAPLLELKPTGSLAAQYCEAVRDQALEARYAFQVAQLESLAKQLDDRLAKIDALNLELKEWFAKRDEFSRKATDRLVGMYGAMRSEAAAEQLAKLDAMTAASILSKLDLRAASAILNDMPSEKAAALTSIIAGAARRDEKAARP